MARKRFVVSAKTQTSTNTHGEPVYTWATQYYLSGTLEYVGGQENATGGVQQQAIGTHRLTAHYRKEGRPTPGNRIVSQDVTYEIISVGDKTGAGKVMVLSLKQVQ